MQILFFDNISLFHKRSTITAPFDHFFFPKSLSIND